VNLRSGIRANGSSKDKIIYKDLSKSQQEIIKERKGEEIIEDSKR